MVMPGRSYQGSDGYRYGFQGQGKDDEIKGDGNSLNYKYRMHDPRIGRFFATDPLEASYPWNSPYAFSENRVLDGVELEGLEWKSKAKWDDEVSDEDLKQAYGTEVVGEKGYTLFGFTVYTEQIQAWEEHKGETYSDLYHSTIKDYYAQYLITGARYVAAFLRQVEIRVLTFRLIRVCEKVEVYRSLETLHGEVTFKLARAGVRQCLKVR